MTTGRPRAAASVAWWLVLVCVPTLSCASNAPEKRPRDEANAALGGEVAARVGDQTIPLSVVESVARAQRISPREAVRLVIDDEIAASAARSRGLDRRPPASWRLVATRARFTLDRFAEEAKRRGPPTNEEVDRLSDRHWLEFARPDAVRVVHALVRRPENAASFERARAVANEIRKAVADAANPDEFEAKAKAVKTDLEVRVERLPPFIEDGWSTETPTQFDATFSKAAFAIPTIGGISPVVETSFGWHVIRLGERIPGKMVPYEERRVAFTAEVHTDRARARLQERLAALRAEHPVEVSPAAEQLMRSVPVSESEARAEVEAPRP